MAVIGVWGSKLAVNDYLIIETEGLIPGVPDSKMGRSQPIPLIITFIPPFGHSHPSRNHNHPFEIHIHPSKHPIHPPKP